MAEKLSVSEKRTCNDALSFSHHYKSNGDVRINLL